MTKRIFAVLLLVAFGLTGASAFAAEKTTGKVLSIEENTLKIEIQGDKPSWVKKNAPVKFEGTVGKVLEVSAEGVTPVVITVKTKKAGSVKEGEAITFQKGTSTAGC